MGVVLVCTSNHWVSFSSGSLYKQGQLPFFLSLMDKQHFRAESTIPWLELAGNPGATTRALPPTVVAAAIAARLD